MKKKIHNYSLAWMREAFEDSWCNSSVWESFAFGDMHSHIWLESESATEFIKKLVELKILSKSANLRK